MRRDHVLALDDRAAIASELTRLIELHAWRSGIALRRRAGCNLERSDAGHRERRLGERLEELVRARATGNRFEHEDALRHAGERRAGGEQMLLALLPASAVSAGPETLIELPPDQDLARIWRGNALGIHRPGAVRGRRRASRCRDHCEATPRRTRSSSRKLGG